MKTPECADMQLEAAQQIKELGLEKSAPLGTFCYEVSTIFKFTKKDWLTLEEEFRDIDLTNLWKPLEDAIFTGMKEDQLYGLGIRDSRAIDIHLRKGIVLKTPPYVIDVSITFYKGKFALETFDFVRHQTRIVG